MTGLYAESHGIVASNMYDPVSHKMFHVSLDTDPMWWNQAQPLWISAQDSGYKTAAMMWPGSDVMISNRTATHFLPYDADVTFQQRLGNVTNWMLGSEEVGKCFFVQFLSLKGLIAVDLHYVLFLSFQEQGVMFAALYWEEPDRSGHMFGPDNDTAMGKVLKEVQAAEYKAKDIHDFN